MPAKIHIEPIDSGKFRVTIAEGTSHTEHTVSLKSNYYEKLTGKRASQEELIEHSFLFLLQHEPKESILREFDLSVISRYFPQYEQEIRKRFTS